jgi:NodT family efflux transporter outer membrane factor (OMF) lipoprotein
MKTCLEKESWVRIFFILLIAIYIAGCTGLSTPRLSSDPFELPDAWMEAQEDVSSTPVLSADELAVWWRQLGDPVLDELVERTIEGSADLESAAAKVKEARAFRGQAKSELGPSISGSISTAQSEALGDQKSSSENFSAALGEQGSSSDSFSASLDMVWEIDLFGAKRLSLEASQADLKAEIENFRAAQVSLVAETVVAYADLRVAEARLRVLDQSLLNREETYQLTDWREQAGLASRLEANQTLSSLGQTRAERPAIEQIATEARLRLDLLAGEMPGALDKLLSRPDLEPAMPAPPNAVSIGIPAETLRQRPDVRSAERQLEAAWSRLGAAEAGRYPTLQLTGSLDAHSEDFGDLFDIDSMSANLLGGLTAPIFESGRIRENIAVREAQWEQAALTCRSIVLEALSEVERALSSFRSSQERIVALEVAARAAMEAAELAGQRYAAGLVDLLSVLDTQRTLFNIEDQLAITKGELLNSFSSLYRALGGGWDHVSQELATTGEFDA